MGPGALDYRNTDPIFLFHQRSLPNGARPRTVTDSTVLTSCASVDEAMEPELLDILSVFPSPSDFSSELSESTSPSPLSTNPRACSAWGEMHVSQKSSQIFWCPSPFRSALLQFGKVQWTRDKSWIIVESCVTQLFLTKALDEGTAVVESLQVAIHTTETNCSQLFRCENVLGLDGVSLLQVQ